MNIRQVKRKGIQFAGIYLLIAVVSCSYRDGSAPIDRFSLVGRHNVVLLQPDTLGSLSVGNGEFAFTVDASGLQTFPDEYENGIPLGTQTQWAWHSIPQKETYSLNDVAQMFASCDSSSAPYAVQGSDGTAAAATQALRANPHRLHLGLVGLVLLKANGQEVKLADLTALRQELFLWSGKIESTYEVEGTPVRVALFSHQSDDRIGVRIDSEMIRKGRLRVKLNFPYGKDCHVCPGYDWNNSDRHTSTIVTQERNSALIRRTLDSTTYFVRADWNGAADIRPGETPHQFELTPSSSNTAFEFAILFDKNATGKAAGYSDVEQSSMRGWKDFWTTGGAIDFSECTDPRAPELERRVILSQYLTRIQCAGSMPPQETGLTMNSWYGKFHLEMHWWHAAQFSLWGKPALLEKSMDWYNSVLPKAKATAQWQGYVGARWQKMTDPFGSESPSSVGAFIIWQQPHPIYLAELLYRSDSSSAVLAKYRDMVFATADFMASFVKLRDGKYHLCHPLIPAQEIFKATETDDPVYELQYWYYGLEIAQRWRERLGMKRKDSWENVRRNLAPLAVHDGMYLPNATTPEAYNDNNFRRDHPAVTGALGFLPLNERLDTAIMAKTFYNIVSNWQWESTWGWDYPLLAMTAARLYKGNAAVNALLMNQQKNTYLINGHNYQDKRLRLYLPGNGGVLAAVAMMTAGWDGCTEPLPGFPKNGKWKVKWEGIERMM